MEYINESVDVDVLSFCTSCDDPCVRHDTICHGCTLKNCKVVACNDRCGSWCIETKEGV